MSTGSGIMYLMSPTERAQNRYGEGAKLRDELLDATVQLMARHGSADQLTLRGIAREVGVSPTAIYRHFEGHEEMVVEAVRGCWQTFDSVMLEASTIEDPFDALFGAGVAYLQFADENPGRYKVMFSNKIHLELEETKNIVAFDVLVSIIARILTALDDPRDPTFVAYQVFSWVHGIASFADSEIESMEWPPSLELLAGLAPALGLANPNP